MARLINPLSGMLLFVAVYSAYSVVMVAQGGVASEDADALYRTGFALLLTWWVYRDRHDRGYPVPFEFEAFVFFAGFVVVPYYLFCTRGLRAVLLCMALLAVCILPLLSTLIAEEIFW